MAETAKAPATGATAVATPTVLVTATGCWTVKVLFSITGVSTTCLTWN